MTYFCGQMETTVKNITIRIIVFIMIGIMGTMITNKAVYLHVHKLSTGEVVTHAHPYNKTQDSQPIKTHHHSSIEFLLIQNLEVIFPLVLLTLAFFGLNNEIKVRYYFLSSYQFTPVKLYRGRAPPWLK